MSDLGDYLAATNIEAAPLGAQTLIAGGAIRIGLNEGLSGAAVLRQLRDAGMGIRTQDFYGLVRTMRAEQQAGLLGETGLSDQLPDANLIPEVSIGKAGTYVTNLRATFRVAEGAGEYRLQEQTMSITSRVPLSPIDAGGVLAEIMAEHTGSFPNFTLLDLSYMGTVLHTGRP